MSSRNTSTIAPAPSVTARSSRWSGPKRKSSRANGQSSVRLNIVMTARMTRSSVRFGRRRAVASDALNERFTNIKLTIVTINEKKTSARTSASGIPLPSAATKMTATTKSAQPPCKRPQAINGPESSGSSGARGGRRITSSSSVSASNTSEHTGSITISKNAMCTGPNRIGKPSSSGSNASPAIGT